MSAEGHRGRLCAEGHRGRQVRQGRQGAGHLRRRREQWQRRMQGRGQVSAWQAACKSRECRGEGEAAGGEGEGTGGAGDAGEKRGEEGRICAICVYMYLRDIYTYSEREIEREKNREWSGI